jgi:EpsI family protein
MKPWQLAPLAMVAVVWLVAAQSGIQVLEFVIIPVLGWSAILAGFGWWVAARAGFPLAYFYFATPLWSGVNGFFQWSSVYAVRFVLRVAGIPAYFDTNQVQIPEGTFEIAGGCSGLHFAIVALAIAALLGELRADGWRMRVKLALIALALAMLANWVRIFTIILAGHFTHMQHYLVARSHYGYGWVLFGVAMVVFFFIERRMPPGVRRSAAPPAAVSPAAWSVRRYSGLVATLALLGTMGLWHALAARPAAQVLVTPVLPAEWRPAEASSSTWRPQFMQADQQQQTTYRRPDGATVDVHTALYRSQRQGKELSGYYNDVFAGLRLVGQAQGVAQLTDAAGEQSLVRVYYAVDRRSFAGATEAQLWYALRSLLQLRSPASQVVAVRAACKPDCNAAATLLHELKD